MIDDDDKAREKAPRVAIFSTFDPFDYYGTEEANPMQGTPFLLLCLLCPLFRSAQSDATVARTAFCRWNSRLGVWESVSATKVQLLQNCGFIHSFIH
jgi:hypothetical protein